MLRQSPRAFETSDVAGRRTHGSVTAWVAGFPAVLISYVGPLVIFMQAAHAARVPNAELISWIWAVSIGACASGLLLSWWLKLPVITAWPAPGTALLLSLFPGISMPEVAGAYLAAAAIVTAAPVLLTIAAQGDY